MKFIAVRFVAALLAGASSSFGAEASGRKADQIYAELCASCHGPKLEGGKGTSLINGQWRHGGDDESITRSIREGYAELGMPGFAATVNEAETKALVALIRETATRVADPQAKEEHPLPSEIQHSEDHDYRFQSVVEGLEVPWSFTFLPDGRILINERVGHVRVIENGRLLPQPIADTPRVVVKEEAGLMSVVAHPDFAHNGWIYLSFSDPGEGDTSMTKIVRGRLREGRFVDQEEIFAWPREQYQKSYVLYGGRLVFEGDYLFFSVGERGLNENSVGRAQDLTVPYGKIHRVFHDGKIPPDNPFVQTPGSVGSIWSYGHRNPQGLARDPRNGNLWETEHGPRGGDELNFIRRAHNYGWPVITRGMNYDGTPISDKTEAPGMEQPVLNWTPSIATSEIEFYAGDRFPKWKNNLFLGSLSQQKFIRFVIENDRVIHEEELFKNHGRVRDIKTGPDGLLYIALEFIGKPGRLVRLVPATEPRPDERQVISVSDRRETSGAK